MTMKKLIIAAAISTGTVFGTVGTAAHAADTNQKQSTGEYAADAVITTKVKAAFVAESALSAFDIAVETHNGTVALTGAVGTEAEVELAARIARDVEGVKQVRNDIKVDPSKAPKK